MAASVSLLLTALMTALTKTIHDNFRLFFSYLNFAFNLSDFPRVKLCKLGAYVVSDPSVPPPPDPDLHLPVSQSPLSTYPLVDDHVQQEKLPRNAAFPMFVKAAKLPCSFSGSSFKMLYYLNVKKKMYRFSLSRCFLWVQVFSFPFIILYRILVSYL